jgi:hypothetical protein
MIRGLKFTIYKQGFCFQRKHNLLFMVLVSTTSGPNVSRTLYFQFILRKSYVLLNYALDQLM